jgi:hypothetical protein
VVGETVSSCTSQPYAGAEPDLVTETLRKPIVNLPQPPERGPQTTHGVRL